MLRAHIVNASNLPNIESLGKSDPYVTTVFQGGKIMTYGLISHVIWLVRMSNDDKMMTILHFIYCLFYIESQGVVMLLYVLIFYCFQQNILRDVRLIKNLYLLFSMIDCITLADTHRQLIICISFASFFCVFPCYTNSFVFLPEIQ